MWWGDEGSQWRVGKHLKQEEGHLASGVNLVSGVTLLLQRIWSQWLMLAQGRWSITFRWPLSHWGRDKDSASCTEQVVWTCCKWGCVFVCLKCKANLIREKSYQNISTLDWGFLLKGFFFFFNTNKYLRYLKWQEYFSPFFSSWLINTPFGLLTEKHMIFWMVCLFDSCRTTDLPWLEIQIWRIIKSFQAIFQRRFPKMSDSTMLVMVHCNALNIY